MALVRARDQTPQDVLVTLETSQGPLVGALLDQQFIVYAINPKAVDRHRERFRVAGAKSDLRDAWGLPTLLRTDRAQYRPLLPDSDIAQELRALTRDRAELRNVGLRENYETCAVGGGLGHPFTDVSNGSQRSTNPGGACTTATYIDIDRPSIRILCLLREKVGAPSDEL